jgi:hypothetical protein
MARMTAHHVWSSNMTRYTGYGERNYRDRKQDRKRYRCRQIDFVKTELHMNQELA